MEISMWMAFGSYKKKMIMDESDVEDEDKDEAFFGTCGNTVNNDTTVSASPTESAAPHPLTESATSNNENTDDNEPSYKKMKRPDLQALYKKCFKKNPAQTLKIRDLIDAITKEDKKRSEAAAVSIPTSASGSTNIHTVSGTVVLSDDESEVDLLLGDPTKDDVEGAKDNEEPSNPEGTDMTVLDSDDESNDENAEESDPQPNIQKEKQQDFAKLTILKLKDFCHDTPKKTLPAGVTRKADIIGFIEKELQ